VPADLPVPGLAVTLEPFHTANAGFDPLPATRVPVTVADVAEVENLVTITGTPPGRLLLDRAADEACSSWALDTRHGGGRNPGRQSLSSARFSLVRSVRLRLAPSAG
jgi:hypothetical protein